MGTLTGQELVDEVTAHLGGRDDLTSAEIVTALNLTQQRMARAHDFEELRYVDTGTFTITASATTDKFLAFSSLTKTNPREIYSFRVITGDGRSRKLRGTAARELDEQVPEPEFYARGIPNSYVIWAESFELWRVPEEAYDWQIRMSYWPTAFSSADLTPKSDFKEKDDMLINLTVSYLYGRLGEYERAGRFWNIFRSMWTEGQLEDQMRPDKVIASSYADGPSGNARPWLDPFQKG